MLLFYELKEKIFNADVLKDKAIIIFTCLSIIINVLVWYFLYIQIPVVLESTSSDIIPLHYNIYFGIDYIGEIQKLYSLPALGLIILAINVILIFFLYLKTKLLTYYLAFFSMTNQMILLLCVYLIVLFNK